MISNAINHLLISKYHSEQTDIFQWKVSRSIKTLTGPCLVSLLSVVSCWRSKPGSSNSALLYFKTSLRSTEVYTPYSYSYPIFLSLSAWWFVFGLGFFNVLVGSMKIIIFPPIISALINERMYEICNFSLFSSTI